MYEINELRKRITENFKPCFIDLGLKQFSNNIFWIQLSDMIQIVQISFLDNRMASYFESTTASFSIEFGGLYGSAKPFENQKDFPHIHYCQVRGILPRNFQQNAPKKTLSPIEHARRDIWWVDTYDEKFEKVLENAMCMIKKDLKLWLSRLSDFRYLCRYLFWKNENQYRLYGFGKKGSPARIKLLRQLAEKLPNKTMLKWRVLLPEWQRQS